MAAPGPPTNGPRAAFVWECYGPYHRARLAAVREVWDHSAVLGVQISDLNETYAWNTEQNAERPATLCAGRRAAEIPAAQVFGAFRALLREQAVRVAFVPSYWPPASTALLLAARVSGVRVVMMNDSHAGTEEATGLKRLAKRFLVRRFHSGLVAGQPHVRHFARLGLPESRLFVGYDAVDNPHFARRAALAREDAAAVRRTYGLPRRYLLNLGRMVAKKNLSVLIRAYADLVDRRRRDPDRPAGETGDRDCPGLVLVGSGDDQSELRALASRLGLPVIDRTPETPVPDSAPHCGPGVFFYGFRQIDENPAFYALADLFVLPSLRDEWGLVVNEAMACGLPVVVSRSAGCAEDLVEEGGNGFTFDPADPADLSGKIEQILRAADRARAMGQRSEQLVAGWGCDHFARQALRAAEAAVKA